VIRPQTGQRGRKKTGENFQGLLHYVGEVGGGGPNKFAPTRGELRWFLATPSSEEKEQKDRNTVWNRKKNESVREAARELGDLRGSGFPQRKNQARGGRGKWEGGIWSSGDWEQSPRNDQCTTSAGMEGRVGFKRGQGRLARGGGKNAERGANLTTAAVQKKGGRKRRRRFQSEQNSNGIKGRKRLRTKGKKGKGTKGVVQLNQDPLGNKPIANGVKVSFTRQKNGETTVTLGSSLFHHQTSEPRIKRRTCPSQWRDDGQSKSRAEVFRKLKHWKIWKGLARVKKVGLRLVV